jgi:hypothetical protein
MSLLSCNMFLIFRLQILLICYSILLFPCFRDINFTGFSETDVTRNLSDSCRKFFLPDLDVMFDKHPSVAWHLYFILMNLVSLTSRFFFRMFLLMFIWVALNSYFM